VNQKSREIRNRIRSAKARIEEAERDLANLLSACSHKWGEAKYTPDIRRAYTHQGDPPGTRGIDWQGPCHVPAEETPKWTRTCAECGKQETTTQVVEKVVKTPRFGCPSTP
jgi:hypothetical protein